MSFGVVILCIAGLIIVAVFFHQTFDEPQIKSNKEAYEKMQADFLTDNKITITVEYCFSDNYYKNNISWANSNNVRFIVDRPHEKVVVFSKGGLKEFISFNSIIGCEIITDSKVTGGVKRAVVGGFIAGDAGAIIGAATAKPHVMSYKIVIYKKDVSSPKTEIVLIKEKKSTKDSDYADAVRFAENVNAVIKAIVMQ